MNKAIYQSRKTYSKYDSSHIIGYFNEEILENYTPPAEDGAPAAEPWPVAYRYSGEEKDGGTIMQCTDSASYGEVVNAIIRTKYTESEEAAVHRHKMAALEDSSQEYETEWKEYNAFCEQAKLTAREWKA